MHFIVLAIFEKYRIRHIPCDIARLLQYFSNISDRFRNILAILQYFQAIFIQYFLNISVLCEILIYAVNIDIFLYALMWVFGNVWECCGGLCVSMVVYECYGCLWVFICP